MSKTSIVVTGLAWMGAGVGSIESALERLFTSAKQEISLTVFALGTNPDRITTWLENALARGVIVRMIVNRSEEQPSAAITGLKRLTASYSHFFLYRFDGPEESELHAKVIVADRRLALVGSSNLSWHGIVANHELALLVEGETASGIASVLDKLLHSAFCTKL